MESNQTPEVLKTDHPVFDTKDTKKLLASLVIVSYNSRQCIQACLESLQAQADDAAEIVVVDNASADGSADYIAAAFPQVRLIRSRENLGFGGGNNLGARAASGEFLIFLNPDTTVGPGWLAPLIQPLRDDRSVGFATPKILLATRQDRINTCGNDVHFTGFGSLRGWMNPADTLNDPADVLSVSGAAFAVRKAVYDQLGGFDEAFFPAYVEETDLCWRGHLAGYICRYIPDSIVYHDYTLEFSPNKYFWLERNRWQMLLKNLRWRTLFFLLPALLLSEIVSWGYATLNGWGQIGAKLRSYGWVLLHWRQIMQRRKQAQALRRVPDHTVLRRCACRMAYGQVQGGLISTISRWLFDPIYYLFYQFYLLVIRW